MKKHTDRLDGSLFSEIVLSIGNMSDKDFDAVCNGENVSE